MLRLYVPDPSHVLRYDTVLLDIELTYNEEPVEIIDRDMRKLRSRQIPVVRVRWIRRPVEESTWETEQEMRAQYPRLFEYSGTYFTLLSGTKVPLVVDVVMTRLVIIVLACYSVL